ncbi:2OG-Fe(II) oxygenase [Hydrogenophaga sp.]|uniref:2OG-Fe(II) oxygenase n=1 Tax=Hydrogenophaga sp. TaxID=1904254 RepID=UPI00271CB37B|nr:2OG-Fe(II) oxygenase [Hydrogenophaga sp.]MDO8903151.1 2OG-Fe(II) oxygenase [Hydrogenophaga sp.]
MNLFELTLPVSNDSALSMDPQEAKATGAMLAQEYASAEPFPHIVLDGILPAGVLQQALDNFPTEPLKSDRIFDINYGGHHKRQILPYDCNKEAQALFAFLNSKAVLQFLEGLTGISGLIPDPYFEGGGFHEISRGGLLGVHADFRINDTLHLERRINLLIYLNPDWQEEWGGALELWDRKMSACHAKVFPLLNRCVVFSTDADSFHGHPDPLNTPEHVKRRSIALYYYTSSRNIYKEVPSHSTMYYARPTDSAKIHAEARHYRMDEQIQDWLPPKLSRLFFRIRRRLTASK